MDIFQGLRVTFLGSSPTTQIDEVLSHGEYDW